MKAKNADKILVGKDVDSTPKSEKFCEVVRAKSNLAWRVPIRDKDTNGINSNHD